jgi:heme ABC exporter ATP-binding subunit CcmA
MVEITDLRKSFGDFWAVDGISLEVGDGESFALLGPNGAGKTTAVRILSTLLRPTSGTVRIAGFDISEEPEEVKRRIGVVSHNPFLYDEMTALENLEFFSTLYGADRSRIEPLLQKVNLLDWKDAFVGTYSRGMKQRLSIARALLHEPAVLILDEPTGGLDIQSRNIFFEIIEDLKGEGATVLLTTHHMEVAERLCSRAAIMNKGKIVARGDMSKIKSEVESMEEAFLRLTGGME